MGRSELNNTFIMGVNRLFYLGVQYWDNQKGHSSFRGQRVRGAAGAHLCFRGKEAVQPGSVPL